MLNTLTRNPPHLPALTLVFLHYYGGSIHSWDAVVEALAADYRCLPDRPARLRRIHRLCLTIRMLTTWQWWWPMPLPSRSATIHLCWWAIRWVEKLPWLLPPGYPDVPSHRDCSAWCYWPRRPPGPEPIPDDSRQEMLDQPSLSPEKQREAAEKTLAQITRKPLSAAQKSQIIIDNLRASPEGWIAWPAVGSRTDISDRMARITVPVTILVGDQDEAIPPSVQPDMVQPYLLQATLHIIPGAGHLLPLEVPEEVVRLIL